VYGNISRSVGDIHNLVPFKPTFTISHREASKEIPKTTNAIAISIQTVSQLLSGFAELHSRT